MNQEAVPKNPGEWSGASVIPYRGLSPRIDPSAFLCDGVRIVGDVRIGPEASIWFNAVIRGDVHRITIGRRTNVQDNAVIHATLDMYPTLIGDEVTIGHGAILHACTVEDLCLIGMGSTVMDNVTIGKGSLVAAGSLVPPNLKVPPNSLVVGVPGKVRRELTAEEREHLSVSAQHYVDYVGHYRNG